MLFTVCLVHALDKLLLPVLTGRPQVNVQFTTNMLTLRNKFE